MLFVAWKLLSVIICWAWPGNFGRVVSAEKSKLITYGWGLLALVLWTIDLNRQQPVYSTQKPRSAQRCTFYFQSVLPCSMCMLRVRNLHLRNSIDVNTWSTHVRLKSSGVVISYCRAMLESSFDYYHWYILRLLPYIDSTRVAVDTRDEWSCHEYTRYEHPILNNTWLDQNWCM